MNRKKPEVAKGWCTSACMFVLNKKKLQTNSDTQRQCYSDLLRHFQPFLGCSTYEAWAYSAGMYSLLHSNNVRRVNPDSDIPACPWHSEYSIRIPSKGRYTFTEQSVWESSRGVWVSKRSGLDSEQCPPWETQDSDTIAAGQQQNFCSATEETQLHSHRCPAHPLLPNLLHDEEWQQHGRVFIQKKN